MRACFFLCSIRSNRYQTRYKSKKQSTTAPKTHPSSPAKNQTAKPANAKTQTCAPPEHRPYRHSHTISSKLILLRVWLLEFSLTYLVGAEVILVLERHAAFLARGVPVRAMVFATHMRHHVR